MKNMVLIITILVLFFCTLHAGQTTVKKGPAKQAFKKQATTAHKWNAFKEKGIRTIRLTHVTGGNQLKVHMKGIRAALERAGIDERVSVFLKVGQKKIVPLGNYSPSRKARAKGSGTVHFNQMPAIKKITLPKNQKVSQKGNAVLIFKNAKGHVVARITSKIVEGKTALKENTSIPR